MFFDPWSLLLPYHVIGSDNRQQSLLSRRHQAENVGGVMVLVEPWYILSTGLGHAHYCTGLTTCRRYLFWCYCHQAKDYFCSSRRSSSLFMVHGQDGGQVPCSARIVLIYYLFGVPRLHSPPPFPFPPCILLLSKQG
ncbi:predicted protein [Lichtheimia corymbifera JMRC:FSU:9682]|uniref:Uncharacterized protein n=1 Tax=Lichtheimia corymbifera JMRC:FSU:9682 TaxID=1263082 RepID=A0A068S1Y9_9FUNG|nr:predicted protein [Lichtheimia corymbifera JMRC:FSU:9682]